MADNMRVNIGCGQTPVKTWKNYDNSLSILLAKVPCAGKLLLKMKLIGKPQYEFIQFAQSNQIEYGDVTKGLPISDNSVEVLYSSHMLEHLDLHEVDMFLKEAKRLLCPKGIIRLAVPDLLKQVNQYIETGDANAFITGTCMCRARPRTFSQRVKLLLVGTRHHQWMYDGQSLACLLSKHGFIDPQVVPAGETRIPNPQPLDLCERVGESVYVEAEKP